MKKLALLPFFLLIAIVFQSSFISAQSVVLGTATAEVVEIVSLSSSTVNDFSIPVQEGERERVSLGEINILSGINVEFAIIIKAAEVSNETGDIIVFEPAINTNSNINSISGNKTISLTGNALQNKEFSTGIFRGSYSIILAYN
jgi:hypothetical protein